MAATSLRMGCKAISKWQINLTLAYRDADADAWCNSTGTNLYIWFGSDLAAVSQTLDVNGPLMIPPQEVPKHF